jgi:hypothetical protein
MTHKCRPGSPAAILMGGAHHYADGGEAMMSDVGARRAAPNLDQRFKKGGRAMGGAMQNEDNLKATGSYSSRGSEMNKEDRRRARGGAMKYAMGGDIGTNTGSSIARKPGDDAIGRAMGGAAKTRRGYPNT